MSKSETIGWTSGGRYLELVTRYPNGMVVLNESNWIQLGIETRCTSHDMACGGAQCELRLHHEGDHQRRNDDVVGRLFTWKGATFSVGSADEAPTIDPTTTTTVRIEVRS